MGVLMKSETKPSVRVNLLAKQKLEQLQVQTELSQTVLLDRAIDLLERDLMAQQVQSDFEDLARDSKKLATYQKISAIFEGASGDGFVAE